MSRHRPRKLNVSQLDKTNWRLYFQSGEPEKREVNKLIAELRAKGIKHITLCPRRDMYGNRINYNHNT